MRIYLACTDSCEDRDIVSQSKYILETYYAGEKDCLMALDNCNRENFLLDSGAFSYMMGAKCTKEQMVEYLEKYIAFINEYDIKYFFELDVDTIFGLDFVEAMRKRLENGTGKKCIPVWHKNRGVEYWKKTVAEYQYCAIGGLVNHVRKNEYPLIKKMVDYAYCRGVKVHGLGFTKTKVLENEKWRFYSVDSSSWITSATRGQAFQVFKNGQIVPVYANTDKRANLKKMKSFNYLEWCKYQRYMDKKPF